jgi:hypothetical protein
VNARSIDIRSWAYATAILVATGCDNSPTQPRPEGVPTQLTIVGNDAIRTGGTTTYVTIATLSTGSQAEVTSGWTSSDPRIASVQANGAVMGHTAGSVRLEASYQGTTAAKTVEVVADVFGRWLVAASVHQCHEAGAPVSDWWPRCGGQGLYFESSLMLANHPVDARIISGSFSLGGLAAYALGHCEPWPFGFEIPVTGQLSSDGHLSLEGSATGQGERGYGSIPIGIRVMLRGDTRFSGRDEWRGRWALETATTSDRTSWEIEVSSNRNARHVCD